MRATRQEAIDELQVLLSRMTAPLSHGLVDSGPRLVARGLPVRPADGSAAEWRLFVAPRGLPVETPECLQTEFRAALEARRSDANPGIARHADDLLRSLAQPRFPRAAITGLRLTLTQHVGDTSVAHEAVMDAGGLAIVKGVELDLPAHVAVTDPVAARPAAELDESYSYTAAGDDGEAARGISHLPEWLITVELRGDDAGGSRLRFTYAAPKRAEAPAAVPGERMKSVLGLLASKSPLSRRLGAAQAARIGSAGEIEPKSRARLLRLLRAIVRDPDSSACRASVSALCRLGELPTDDVVWTFRCEELAFAASITWCASPDGRGAPRHAECWMPGLPAAALGRFLGSTARIEVVARPASG